MFCLLPNKTSYCNTTSHHQKIQATTTSIKKSNPPSLPLENPIHHPPLENPSHHPPSTNINRNLAIHQPPLQTPTQNQTNNHHKIPSFKPKPKSTNNQVLAIAKEIFFFLKKKKRRREKQLLPITDLDHQIATVVDFNHHNYCRFQPPPPLMRKGEEREFFFKE